MEFTGERVVPGQVDPDLWQEHVSRYVFARAFVQPGARVLDAGCGAGYGAALLAAEGAEVVGVDVSREAVEWARAHYPAPRFVEADCAAVPEPDASFDLIVAFEVIEHLPDAAKFLAEAARLLRPHGVLLVSTPNRRYYTTERGFENPFHTREYDAAEYRALLGAHFAYCQLLEQNHAPAITFTSPGVAMAVSTATGREGDEPYFFLAICSQSPVDARGLVYLPESGNVLRERERHIHKLADDLAAFQKDTARELDERREWAAKLEAELNDKGATIVALQQEMEERGGWVASLEARISERDAQIIERQQGVEQAERDLAVRTAWATELEARLGERQAAVTSLEEELRARTAWASALDADLAAARARIDELAAEVESRNAWAASLNTEIASLGERLVRTQSALEEANASLNLLLASKWYRAGKALRVAPRPTP